MEAVVNSTSATVTLYQYVSSPMALSKWGTRQAPAESVARHTRRYWPTRSGLVLTES
jgi:hypothetical protein